MSANIFRQVALDRLSSPEQLDHMLHATNPKRWIALAGLVVLLAAVLVWGYEGSISTTETGTGVIVRSGGVLNIVTRGSGVVLSLDVKVGDKIKANQVVARVAQPVLAEKLKFMRDVLNEARQKREIAVRTRTESTRLQSEAIDREHANHEREIKELDEQASLAQEEIRVEDELLLKGLVTKQQTITARQNLIHIKDQIASLHAQNKQLEAQQFSIHSQPQKDDGDDKTRISAMERDLDASARELAQAEEVVSPYGGEVLELKVYPGNSVNAAEPILSVQPDVNELELLAYLPTGEAKNAAVGMEVQVSPSSVKREEFGFMKGTVEYVSAYPATHSALMRDFQNESLATSLQSAGPVNEFRVALQHDQKTPSGFKWSTATGAPTPVSSGTICSVQVVVRRQKPIMLLFPYLKEKLGMS
jgi:HlyD family secretion protein